MKDPLKEESIFSQAGLRYDNFKWKFFLSQCLYQTMPTRVKRFSNFHLFSFVFDCLSFLFPCGYILSEYTGKNIFSDSTDDMFHYSQILSFFTPYLMDPTTVITIVSFLMLLAVVCIFISFQTPEFLKYTQYVLNPHVHITLISPLCGITSYAVNYIIYKRGEDDVQYALSIVEIFIFVVYWVVMFFMISAQRSTIIYPSSMFSEWFDDVFPIYFILYTTSAFIFYQLHHVSYQIQLIFLSVISAFSLALGFVYSFYIPMVFLYANEFYAAKLFTNCIITFLKIILISHDVAFKSWAFSIIPMIFVCTFLFSHLIANYRRNKYAKIFERTNHGTDNLTLEAVSSIFSEYNHELDFRMIVKAGLINGAHIVTNEAFASYLLVRFQDSQWMIRFVNFLYAVVWGMNDTTYKYFLHVLSLTSISFWSQYTIFENLYCYMQISTPVAPSIAKELESLRSTVMQYAMQHRAFWSTSYQDDKDYFSGLQKLHVLYKRVSSQVKRLKLRYPFSSEVGFETSLFYADMKHDFKMAAVHYGDAIRRLKFGPKEITFVLNEGFRPFYNGAALGLLEEPREAINEYTFLSVCDQDSMLVKRHTATMMMKDPYLRKISRAYTANRNQVFTRMPFVNDWLIYSNVVFYVGIVIFILLIIGSCMVFMSSHKTVVVYNEIWEMAQSTKGFINDVTLSCYLSSAIYSIINDTYTQYSKTTERTKSSFRSYCSARLMETEQRMIKYMEVVEAIRPLIDIDKSLPEGAEYNFSYYFTVMHSSFVTVMYSSALDVLENEQFKASFNESFDIIMNTSITYFEKLIEGSEGTISYLKEVDVIIVVGHLMVTVIIGVVIIVIFYFFDSELKNSMTLVLNTIQDSVKIKVAAQFDRLLDIKEPTIEFPRVKSRSMPLYLVVIAFFFVIAPFFIYLAILISTKDKIEYTPLVRREGRVEEVEYQFYTQIFLEFQVNSRDHSGLIMFDSATYPGYYERYIASDGLVPKNTQDESQILLFKYLNSTGETTLTTISIIAAISVAIIFTIEYFRYQSLFKDARYIYFSIPLRIARTNPVFFKIITGQKVTRQMASDFIEANNKLPYRISLVSYIELYNDDRVEQVIGDIEGLIGCYPLYLDEIRVMCNAINEKEKVDEFFQNRDPNVIQYGACRDDREFSIQFLSRTSLLLKDASYNMEWNRRARRGAEVTAAINRAVVPPEVEFANGGAAILWGVAEEVKDSIIDIARSLKVLKIADARHDMLQFVFPIDEANMPGVLEDIFGLASVASTTLQSWVICIAAGGKVGSGKPRSSEIRITGESYRRCFGMIFQFYSQKAIAADERFALEAEKFGRSVNKIGGTEFYTIQ